MFPPRIIGRPYWQTTFLILRQILNVGFNVTSESKSNIKLQSWIAIASATLLIAKFTAYYLTHSVSILTDALESIVNVVAGFIGLYSLYVAAKPKDVNHPYGHGKAEFISAAVEGTLIFSTFILLPIGLFLVYSAMRDSQMFNKEFYFRFARNFKAFFKKLRA